MSAYLKKSYWTLLFVPMAFYLLGLGTLYLKPNILSTKGIHPHGYWLGTDVLEEHWHDPYLASAIVNFLKYENTQTVVDLGCGTGEYVKEFIHAGFYSEGYDGNPDTENLSNGFGHTLDLSKPIFLLQKYDWVVSLEVGEHIPKKFERAFIENLVRHAKQGIILSWAIEGQGGYGHFNERSNDYIKQILETEYGFLNDLAAEEYLREQSSLYYFKDTLMVFRRVG